MLSKSAEYALRAVVWLARQPGTAKSAEQLANVTKVPRRYLHRVLQDLVRAGLVRSQPGPGGGYSLRCQPDRVTILDVVNAVAPLERIHACPLGLPAHTQLCALHAELDSAIGSVEQAFRRVTLSNLVNTTEGTDGTEPLCRADQAPVEDRRGPSID